MKVLIDGENLRHQIAEILLKQGKISVKNDFFKFNFKNFFEELTGEHSDIIYYSTKIKQPKHNIPAKLTKSITAISKENRKLLSSLSNQGIEVVKAGHLRVRESSACVHCGKKTLILQEKGVDVRLATDIVMFSKNSEKSIGFVSSDSDIVPALQTAKNQGASLNYICYAAALNRSVATQAAKVITYNDALVLKHFGVK